MVWVLNKNSSSKDIAIVRKKIEENSGKGIDTRKYCGTIKLKKDALKLQKEARSGWD